MLDQLRAGDTVVMWRLDRLGRSLRHLVDMFGDFEERGVTFRSLAGSIDTSTPGGKLVFQIFGALAEFEAGSDPRADGRRIGCPGAWASRGPAHSLDGEKLATALSMYQTSGQSVATIARVLGVSRASVYRTLAARIRAGSTGRAPVRPRR